MGWGTLEKNPHLVNLLVICKDKKKWWVGLKESSTINKSLLRKWPRGLERDMSSRKLIAGKYDEEP